MNLKEFLSDPTLQKDENGNILCRKIKNSKLHHMKPQFCMSPRLHSEGWEIVRKLEPPTPAAEAIQNKFLLPPNGLPEGVDLYKEAPHNETPISMSFKFNEPEENTSLPPVKVKTKRKTKRKTTTKRKRTVKTLTPETNNG